MYEGKFKRVLYDWQTRQETLVNDSIDKAAAIQRVGRDGRTRPGVEYSLNSADHYNNVMHDTRVPDIARCYPTSLVLKITAHGVKSLLK